MLKRRCEVCGKEFFTKRGRQKTCSPDCSRERHRDLAREAYWRSTDVRLETIKNDADYNPRGCCPYRKDDRGRSGVLCGKKGRNCKECGWHPEVEKRRIEKLREGDIFTSGAE